VNWFSRTLAVAIAGWLIGLVGMAGPLTAKDPYLAAQLAEIDRVNAAGRWDADWQSLCQHESPEWFQDAKFGIYADWGVYSVPAFGNEWHPRNMYRHGNSTFQHHVERYGGPDKFGYKNFVPQFTAEKFDAEAWAELYARSGAKLAGPVARVSLLGGGPLEFAVNQRKQPVIDVGDLSAGNAPCRYAYSFRLEGFDLDIQPDAVREAPQTEMLHD
jgi:hypothetical protein